jgi:Flp pilus assembly protein CpaB
MNRRLLIIIAFVIVLVGVGIAAFLAFGQPPTVTDPNAPVDASQQTGGGGSGGPAATVVVPTEVPYVEIVIAVQDLPRGITIPPNAVALRRWPEEVAPFNAETSIERIVGKIARTDIYREQPILTNMVVESLTGIADIGSDLAAILPAGNVAVAVPIDRVTSVAYGIQPGDRVDVIMSMLFIDVDDNYPSQSNCAVRSPKPI